GKVHLDLALNFGVRSAPGVWGRVADVMAWILKYKGVEALLKWVDDFIFFCFPVGVDESGASADTVKLL
ncbi:hypothetical protein FB446DRAFT_656217, partial [Lentinula raphanica]